MRLFFSHNISEQNTISSNEKSPKKPNSSQTNKSDGILGRFKNKLSKSTLSDLPTSFIQKNSAHTDLLVSKKPVLNASVATQKFLVSSKSFASAAAFLLINKELEDYRRFIIENEGDEVASCMGFDFIEKDAYFLKFFAKAENSRKKGLNLNVFNDKEDFLNHLCKINKDFDILEYHGRAIIRFTSVHFISADIKVIKNEKGENITTVIFIDSLSNKSQKNADSLRKMLDDNLFKGVISSGVFLDAGVQSSLMDCAIFSMSHALKFHKNQEAFSKIHDELKEIYMKLPESYSEEFKGIYPADKHYEKFLTSGFYKHTQSERKLKEIVDARGWNEEAVSKKNRDTLLERYGKKLTNIQLEDGSVITKNNSIGNKRLNLLQHAIDFYKERFFILK